MEMDISKGNIVGLLILFGLFLSANAQCNILNCKTCGEQNGAQVCLTCNEDYGQNAGRTACCSKGCQEDALSYLSCNANDGRCTYEGCKEGYIGEYCQRCSEKIQNCDGCVMLQDTTVIQCTNCATDFFITTDQQHCCPQGCDSCTGTDGTICTSCKATYYLYNEGCDTCGNNCVVPSDGSARCDPVDGRCYLGCQDGWHGPKCDVECTLSRCDRCDYNTNTQNLTCADCSLGYYGPYCGACGVNCSPTTAANQELCYQDGTCANGCKPGYRGNKCDIACDSAVNLGNCDECERYPFRCTKCKPNYWGDQCQNECNQNCVVFGGARTCSIDQGSCDFGCLAGYYKHDCSGSCPFCGNDVCDRTSGDCLDPVCDPGYHGSNCNFTCPTNCVPDPVSGNPVCNFQYGNCTNGCIDGRWGAFCNQGCSVNCAFSPAATETGPLCEQRTGNCDYQCKPGYFGHDCRKPCESRCVDERCDITAGTCLACNVTNPGYLCPEGICPVGKYGQFCQTNCTDNCILTCGRYNGTCFGCDPGYHDSLCDLRCGQCSSGTCDQKSGLCTTDCNPGYWNMYCNQTCLHGGCKTCFQGSGQCETCDIGLYGFTCSSNCSKFCARDSFNQIVCEKDNGYCSEGKCLPGYWNKPCDAQCNEKCLANSDGARTCSVDEGDCDIGCEPTYYGGHCNLRCSVTCLNQLCERDGVCSSGCVDGAYGSTCELSCKETCNNGKCDRSSGECSECDKPLEVQTELCRTAACRSGKTGLLCNENCPENCFENCDRYNSTCATCKPSFFGYLCEHECGYCSGVSCGQITGTCISHCLDGYFGDNCTLNCNYPGCLSCDRSTGECDVCKPGFWTNSCSESCSSACVMSTDGNTYCDKESGGCRIGACIPGYYSESCTLECNMNCLPDSHSDIHCDFRSGVCRDGCVDGFYANYCNVSCNSNCVGGVCERNGECLRNLGCLKNYYGFDCGEVCLETCNDNTCHRDDGVCDACRNRTADRSPLCRDAECKPINGDFYHGLNCSIPCSEGCASTCQRYSGVCDACKIGLWGPGCLADCGSCKDVACFQNNGTCFSDCTDGFFGPGCDTDCLYEGCNSCDRITGKCRTCKQGLWGENCADDCSQACIPSNNGLIYCEKDTGVCSPQACISGYYSPQCTSQCSENCLPPSFSTSGVGSCGLESGVCDDGCKTGWYGDFCDIECSFNCVENTCYRNGSCNFQLGCVQGFYGFDCTDRCTQTCNDGTCDRDAGNCAECDKPVDEQSPLCRSAACDPPYYGLFCNQTCALNCKAGLCGRYTRVCDSCIDDFYGDECDKPCGNCRGDVCDQSTSACANGCDDGFYTVGCTAPCIHNGCQTCNITNGECTSCKVELWGNNCNSACSQTCLPDTDDGNIYCDRYNAYCAENACVSGYFGRDCTQKCNTHCGMNDLGLRPCNIDTGVCDEDKCEQTWYGPQCSLECPVNCVNNNCNRTGVCVEGCLTGYWGPMCQSQCQLEKTCNDATCDQYQGECLDCLTTDPTPLCRTAACRPANTWGLFCQFTCTENCADGTCSRDDGTCTACKPEKYGKFCSNACPNCGTDQCYQTDGVCVDSCDPGWYQLDCMTPCKHDGCLECDRNTGECISCKAGKFGTNCSLECATTCASDSNGVITCNRFSGECDTKACITGYYTPQCTKRCSQFCEGVACDIDSGTCAPCVNGWYGQRCDGECSTRCKNKDCEVLEDNCRLGCTDGYWGGSCEKTCNVNCDSKACNAGTASCLYGCNATKFFGMTCAEPCNGNCIEDICNRTGYCLKGCEVGWYGDQCQYRCQDVSKCTDGTCERLAGICEDCNTATPGPNCPTAECPSGKRGNTCEEDCTSSNCLYDQCGRYTDKCNACPAGYYGDKCELICSRCKAGTGCDQATGVCIAGCKDGWYRPDCNTNCSNVCGSCERQSGECVTCAAGRWGNACDLTCSSNCVETIMNGNSMVFCDKASGKCREQACKVGFWREDCTQACNSNCLQDDNNNRVCKYLDGECSNGCKEKFYGKTCSGLCSTRCREQLCTNFEDTCDLGCADGYYGATCDRTCSVHCAGQGRCYPSTGECLDGCELGYYGLRCDDQCKNTCNDGTCNDVGGCTDCGLDPVGPNCRVQVCNPGLYGPTCESECPGDYCLNNQCKRTTGTCENGCLDGYYGAYCTEVCQCDRSGTSECEQTKGECLCRPGNHGTLCDQRCSTGCIDFTCERDGTCTHGCESGKFGSKCEDTCTNCLNQACNSANGNCLQGCVEGWYGPQCNLPCKAECRTCDIQTGECTSCVNSYYSFPACDKTCSINCNIQGSDRTCNQVNGDCIYGCKTGYYSLDCSESCGNCDRCNANDGSCPTCNAGWWGTTCKNQCSSYCARGGSSNERMCRQSDGYCEFGCEAGYYGETCSSACISRSCANGVCDRQTGACTAGCLSFFYGTNCDQRCDNCKDGQCEQANGYCIGDCPANSYGNQCDKECLKPLCNDATCDKYSGYCSDCQISPKGSRCSVQDPVTEAQVAEDVLSVEAIIGVTVGSVAFVIIFVVVFVCCMNYKRRYDDAKTEIHLPSDVIERLSTHRSLHSTTSTNYPVARVVGDDEKDFVLF
ncbi:multiple epidermal growth factor-like domains protein 6 isoform X10 [Mercenaria mercenaria]|uniref:multiple epidermal growth factor-like domains protein 6 isoform X10 n=1 Tax=Mercenaria mercenaria TaxID=6596 RepID=UPI00234E840E|nr:multiple epidermal growth factor-like domains protein 6 isoform X10 [Mercenaria mercenaria]